MLGTLRQLLLHKKGEEMSDSDIFSANYVLFAHPLSTMLTNQKTKESIKILVNPSFGKRHSMISSRGFKVFL